LSSRIKLYQDDVNVVVNKICDEIQARDAEFLPGKWQCFNIAFLDPTGLELHWDTVARLASMGTMDLIINFSTSTINRVLGKAKRGTIEAKSAHQFFGTDDWPQEEPNATYSRRAWIDFYLERLKSFGYVVDIDPDWGGMDMAVKNSKNSQVYSMVFASKHELGNKFWSQSTKKAQPPKLPGF